MDNGRITLGKQSGGTLGLVFPDGVSNTEVVLPESGELATKDYVDTRSGELATKDYVDTRAEPAFVANDDRVKTAVNASGNAPIYACRAWVNFDGTGPVAIRASGNVSSITWRGAGRYTVNFRTPLIDNNYCVGFNNRIGMDSACCALLKTTSAFNVAFIGNIEYSYADDLAVSIFR